MKENKNKVSLSEKEWELLASRFSGESSGKTGPEFDDITQTEKLWKDLGSMEKDRKIDVDSAWNKVYSRISNSEAENIVPLRSFRIPRFSFMKAAAAITVIAALGALLFLLTTQGLFSSNIAFETGSDQVNLRVNMPDGSTVYLNRSSGLSYDKNFGKNDRHVILTGEAFFEITPDASKPFTIDAGDALVEVVGTSFNVITDNPESQVEVFVKTGLVKLEDNEGKQSVILEPGYVGKLSSEKAEKKVNQNPNYLAWNTGKLVYKGEKLEVVFRDLKRVYNMNIVADDPSISQLPWTAPIDYQPRENIIQMICLSFGLSYEKDGDVYHLYEK